MVPARGEAHSASEIDVALVRELVLVVHVAQDRVRDPGVNPLEKVLLIDGRVHAVLAEDLDGDDGDLLGNRRRPITPHLAELPSPDGDGVGSRQPRRFEESVRIQPHLELPELGHVRGRRHGRASGAVDVPGMRTVHREHLVRVLLKRCPADPADAPFPRSGVPSGLPLEFLRHRAGFPVHHSPVVGERFAARPIDVLLREPLLSRPWRHNRSRRASRI